MEAATTLDAILARGRARRRLPKPAMRRLLRQRAGVSQRDIASVLRVDAPTVSRWESGYRSPTGALLERYVALLDRLAAER